MHCSSCNLRRGPSAPYLSPKRSSTDDARRWGMVFAPRATRSWSKGRNSSVSVSDEVSSHLNCPPVEGGQELHRLNGASMATLVGSVHQIELSPQRSHAASSTTAKSRLVEMWPQTIIVLGLGLSLLWTASLFWLLYEIV